MGRLDDHDRINLARLFIAVVQLDVDATIDQLQRMGIADYKVDRASLNHDLRRLLLQYYGTPIYDINAREVFKNLQPIVYEYKLRVPTDLWLLVKTSVIMQGVGLALDPEFDIFKAAQPFLGRIFRQLWLPTSWGPGLLRAGLDWKDLLSELPRQSIRLLDQLDRGDFTVQAKLPQLEPTINQVERIVDRVIYAIILSALLIGLAFLVPRLDFTWPWRLITWIIVGGFLVLLFLVLRLAWSYIRCQAASRRSRTSISPAAFSLVDLLRQAGDLLAKGVDVGPVGIFIWSSTSCTPDGHFLLRQSSSCASPLIRSSTFSSSSPSPRSMSCR
jgi:ubiquinone biosynthesis protein